MRDVYMNRHSEAPDIWRLIAYDVAEKTKDRVTRWCPSGAYKYELMRERAKQRRKTVPDRSCLYNPQVDRPTKKVTISNGFPRTHVRLVR